MDIGGGSVASGLVDGWLNGRCLVGLGPMIPNQLPNRSHLDSSNHQSD